MKRFSFIILVMIACVAVNWLALIGGWWWFTTVVGLLIGLFLGPSRLSFLVSLGAGSLGWGLPLGVLAMNAPVISTANAVESVIGLSSTGGGLIIVLTIVLGCVMSVVGTWVGIASKSLRV